ncbi:MAG: glycoside hydrolase family 2, partial [Alistipes sp.]|nr:glycoside hydrolase family 2 [Alistipes sp.]
MKKMIWMALGLLLPLLGTAQTNEMKLQEISVAGLVPLDGCGRLVYDFNGGWRFFKGDVAGAEAVDFDDRQWEVVSTPHTVELTPAEASGCRNYQGKVWYRKHFTVPSECGDKEALLHFEAVMGKQKFYINGKLVEEHLGGYLPVMLSLTKAGVKAGERCVVAVEADNTNDKMYPPGKPQYTLDFAYHGGIYRDVWLIARSKVGITDPIEEGKVAGGGIFVHFEKITDESAEVHVSTEVRNDTDRNRSITVETSLVDQEGNLIKCLTQRLSMQGRTAKTAQQKFVVKNPTLWSPENPYLYRIETRIK